jgi:hypothetical protein
VIDVDKPVTLFWALRNNPPIQFKTDPSGWIEQHNVSPGGTGCSDAETLG